ncbi:hypothetical protein EYC80_002133 [Monilinia laxa]|uniref:F-box domain-containing protein n=1 Tax=Monilinia laxa TaxID=61186 RepID=A0A5N6K2X7_MONLA|nr:hypothetical protein EYC80_002133 [Monilinia laxa]
MSPLTFLDLPGEIRNQIYHLLLIVPPISTPRPLGSDPPIYPQILSVCRKVHDEAEQILYGGNVFIAHPNLLNGLPRLRWKYDTISSSKLISIIKKYYIIVRLDCDPNFTEVRAEDAFNGMEGLTIRVEQSAFRGSDYQVLKLFEGVRGVKKTKISGSVSGFPAYVEWLQDVMKMPKGIDIAPFERGEDEAVQNLILDIKQISMMNSTTQSADKYCAFLETFPAEIRLKIYKHLLCNKILGTAECVTQVSSFGAQLKYELSPQVLRLCHKIYEEAVPVLYEKNTFYIACLRVENHPYAAPTFDYDDDESGKIIIQGPQVELCPLTRYENDRTTVPFPTPSLYNHTTVRKVLHWRAVVSRLRTPGGTWDPRWCLLDFCRTICANSPATLELLLLPCGLDDSQNDEYSFECIDQVLKPLRMLRNLRKFTIDDACATDVPDIIRISTDKQLDKFKEDLDEGFASGLEISADTKTEIQTLVTSQQPVDLLYNMHEALATYAQAFERYRPYKMQMGLRREDINDIDERDLEYSEYIRTGAFNPFIKPTFHPLEFELQICKESATSGDVEIFKEHRRNALKYLESQFFRVETANREITEFVKQEKVPRGLFDIAEREKERSTSLRDSAYEIDYSDKHSKIARALVYLEDYATSFNRDLTHTVRAQILSNRRLFESHYHSLTRDLLIKTLGRDTEVGQIRQFLTKYSTAVDMCDMQYLEILQARKRLFKFDGFEPECDIGLKLSRSEEMIDWNTSERDLTPSPKWIEYNYGDSSEDEM